MSLHETLDALFDLVLPAGCVRCGSRPGPGLPLCGRCGLDLCPVDPVAMKHAAARLEQVAGIDALWMIDPGGAARALVHALKYRGVRRLGPTLGRMLGRSTGLAGPPDAVVPVPLHRSRLRERGYNQAELIARGLAEVIACPMPRLLLERPRAAASQTRIGRRERVERVRHAFTAPDPRAIQGRRILLVDDVLTTGATAAAAADTLLAAGAGSVRLAVVGLTRSPVPALT